MNQPLFTNDAIVFGILMISLGFVFYTESKTSGFWHKFYKIVPGLFMAYFIPAIFTTIGAIAPEWQYTNTSGEIIKESSQLYYVASRFLLPAALVLMTLSIDLKAIFNLGSKALIMFFTGTLGIIIGGPIAILLISLVSPETVGGADFDAVWRGLSTLAGSWIGGGANQTAMLEVYQYNPAKYGGMIFVDIVVANVWMAILLIGIGKKDAINKWLKADTSAIEELKENIDKPDLPVTKDSILVLKGCGPKGYPGMPEVGNMPMPRVLVEKGVRDMIRISDARMSGTAFGTIVLHVAPDANVGGPISIVETGDRIRVDALDGVLELLVPETEIKERLKAKKQPEVNYSRGYAKLYIETVLQADKGADLDFLVGKDTRLPNRESH